MKQKYHIVPESIFKELIKNYYNTNDEYYFGAAAIIKSIEKQFPAIEIPDDFDIKK